MSHRSTTLAQHREKDRQRQRARRERLRALGAPLPHQVDNAVSEAVSFAISIALVDKTGVRAQAKIQTISAAMIYTTALDILTQRWRFNPDQAAIALNGRLAKRPEHFNRSWTPHYPWLDVASEQDMSTTINISTPVTSSGRIQTEAALGNTNIERL